MTQDNRENKVTPQTDGSTVVEKKQDFLDIVEIIYFNDENARFYRTPNGFAALEAFIPPISENDLKEDNGDGEGSKNPIWQDLGRVFFHRAFPFDRPNEFVSVTDKESKEYGIIKNIEDLGQESREIINAELSRKYFCPVISKINSCKERFGYSYWEVESNYGALSFAMHDTFRNIIKVSESRIVLNDVDGNRYELPDVLALDRKSYRKIELYL